MARRAHFVATILNKASIQRILRHEGLDTPEPRAGSSQRDTHVRYEVDEHALADIPDDDFSQVDTNDLW